MRIDTKLLLKTSLPKVHPFLNNKYTYWYYDIINQALLRNSLIGYIETHHIIPNCFYIINRSKGKRPGWLVGNPNEHTNKVKLTAREHFICHWLLTKMTLGKPYHLMNNALAALQMKDKNQDRIYTSIQYERIRIANIEVAKNNNLFRNYKSLTNEQKLHLSEINIGKKMAQKTKDKISATTKGRPSHLKGKKLSEEHKHKISENHAKNFLGKHHSAETKIKISKANTGKKWFNNGTINLTANVAPDLSWSLGMINIKIYNRKASGIKISLANTGKTWWSNGISEIKSVESPGILWNKGRLKR